MGGARSKGGKGVEDFKPCVTRSIPVGARIVVQIIQVQKLLKLLTYINIKQEHQDFLRSAETFVML